MCCGQVGLKMKAAVVTWRKDFATQIDFIFSIDFIPEAQSFDHRTMNAFHQLKQVLIGSGLAGVCGSHTVFEMAR